jgi:endonuclease/exonuclease/phosphatase family metal-dependent hydrolase
VKKFLYKILFGVNLFFGSALLISYTAVHINPDVFTLPAFFGLAYPYLLLINIIIVITWIALLRFEALISIVIIAIGYTHLTNYIRIWKPGGEKKETFKVLSYNVRLFNAYEEGAANSEHRIVEFLKNQQPDIICLQEFFAIGIPSLKETEIRNAIGGKYYSHMKMISTGKNKSYGIVTYSKFPIIRKGEMVHPKSSSLSIFTDVLIEKDTFRIFNNHLQSFGLKKMDRSFLEEIAGDNEALGEVRRLSSSLKRGFVRRAQQAQLVKTQINLSPYPVIVAGDFNDTPVSYSYRKIRKGLNDAFLNSGYGAGFTYKGNYPANRIDYILYDNALESRYFEIIKVRFSDHYPVSAFFRKSN